MLKLLGISGIIPDFSGCSICSDTNGEYYILDFDSGSILCGKCTMKHFSMNKITLSQLNLINKLTYVNVNEIKNMSFDEFTLEECNNMIVILNNYITYTLHRKTNSFKFLSDMLELK